MATTLRVRAPAKINLALGSVRCDGTGSTELATVYQAVSLFDELEVTDRADGRGLRISVAGRESGAVLRPGQPGVEGSRAGGAGVRPFSPI